MTARQSAEVVIIGAGAAGLAAGRLLAQAGKQVVIVEARARIGGRIYTRHTAPIFGGRAVPVELGAEFIHGLPDASWSVVRAAQLATIELHGEQFCFDGRRLEHCDERQHDSFRVLKQMEAWLAKRAPGSDPTFEDYLREAQIDPAKASRAAAYVEGFNAADRHLISATALVRQQRAEDQAQGDRIFHIRPGYDALPAFLADSASRAGSTLLLGCPVRGVRWSEGRVAVEGERVEGGAFCIEARQAIITLPLGVLQSDTVKFDPLPTEMARAWHSLAMGQAHRITLLFERAFWSERAAGLSFLFAHGELIPTWWTAMPDTTPIITGWVAGASALSKLKQAEMDSPVALESAALRTLAKICGTPETAVRRWLVAAHHHDWHTDEFSRGAYSYVSAGAQGAAQRLGAPLERTLFFAGEHTDIEDQWGTVHAALASGMRASMQLFE